MAAQTEIAEAPELHNAAQPLIREHHPHLKEARILYLFTSAKSTRAGRPRTGLAKRCTPEQRFLSSGLESVEDGYDFMLVVNKSRYRMLSPEQQMALLDHELCHCGQKETVNRRTGAITRRWISRGHDVEEFSEIVKRHGLWNPDVKQLVHAGAQMALPIEPEAAAPPSRTTTVDERGVVLSTELEDVTEESSDLADEDLPHRTNGHAPPPDASAQVEQLADGWQERVGLGGSEPEQRRRSRHK